MTRARSSLFGKPLRGSSTPYGVFVARTHQQISVRVGWSIPYLRGGSHHKILLPPMSLAFFPGHRSTRQGRQVTIMRFGPTEYQAWPQELSPRGWWRLLITMWLASLTSLSPGEPNRLEHAGDGFSLPQSRLSITQSRLLAPRQQTGQTTNEPPLPPKSSSSRCRTQPQLPPILLLACYHDLSLNSRGTGPPRLWTAQLFSPVLGES